MRTQLSSAMALALQVAAMERAPGRVAEERALTLRLMPTPSFHAPDTVAPTPIGGLRPNGGKYGPFTISTRERSRLAWRQRVDAAARATHAFDLVPGEPVSDSWIRFGNLYSELDAALAAPRPWRSPRKPDPRNHYPRRHRRACKECRCARGWLRMSERVAHLDPSDPYRTRFVKFTRNPHGRSDR